MYDEQTNSQTTLESFGFESIEELDREIEMLSRGLQCARINASQAQLDAFKKLVSLTAEEDYFDLVERVRELEELKGRLSE